MVISAGTAVKAVATMLCNEKFRRGIGWTLAAVMSPLILIAAVFCSIGAGAAAHNNHAVKASFYGVTYSEEIPANYKVYVEEMRLAFSLLDSSVASVNSISADGNGLDPLRVKAVF